MGISFENRLKAENYNLNRNKQKNVSFQGPDALSHPITKMLKTIDTNDFISYTAVDIVAMVAPRTIIDAYRNKFAAFETFFREISGTITNCLSPGLLAFGFAALYNKMHNKKVDINPNIWANEESYNVLKQAWDKGEKNVDGYIGQCLDNIQGLNGTEWKPLSRNKILDISKDLKSVIENPELDNKATKKALIEIEDKIVNALGAGKNIKFNFGDEKFCPTIGNLLRDTVDLGKNIFTKFKPAELEAAEKKFFSMDKKKAAFALILIGTVDFFVQYINRYITKKRTGKDDFVGYQDFTNGSSSGSKSEKEANIKKVKLKLLLEKLVATAGVTAMAYGIIMGGFKKSPTELLSKLKFTGKYPSVDQIRAVYAATLAGRFMASRDRNELRETCVRDYFGFLNWLVLGNVVSKAVAQKLDPTKESLFNIKNIEKANSKKLFDRVSHWINGTSLKSHAEIAAIGGDAVKKNIRNLNIANSAGLMWSSLALGIGIPLINMITTNRKRAAELARKNAANPAPQDKPVLCQTFAPDKTGKIYASFTKNI